ncbi:MAG: glycoside hydrolase family 9 protein [Spirochaetales bacterium]|nr:glycoside hydrolase family 9 protein [Spirochaetales bacterium]
MDDPALPTLDVRLNSVGFPPDSPKMATVAKAASTFDILDAASKAVVHSGGITGPFSSGDTGETVYIADFSAFTDSGIYIMEVPGVGKSARFTIDADVYRTTFHTAMLGMYLWRSGTAVSGSHNGTTFSHSASHLNDGYLTYITGANVIRDGTGGWYDAGDYGKYTVNAGITVGMMFKAWEHFKTILEPVTLSIPETGGTLPDYLDEIKWELDFIIKMQYTDGTYRVCHKLTPLNFSGFVMPQNDTSNRYFAPYSSAATADFVAMLAQAARIYQPYDAAFAASCLQKAEESCTWLDANPGNHEADLSAFSTGGYQTDDADDRLWAAAELWETTGESGYLDDVETRIGNKSPKIDSQFDWPSVGNLGMLTYYFSERGGKAAALTEAIGTSLLDVADDLAAAAGSNAYGRPMGSSYYWGCNGTVARQALILRAAYMVSSDRVYLDTALDAISHLLGRNCYGRSYVTGVGYHPPKYPHDRRSGADSIDDPWPGYLVGGGHTATGWVDEQASYETNEIAVNWNGALIYALAGFLSGS